MKKTFVLAIMLVAFASATIFAQETTTIQASAPRTPEYKIITVIESIIQGGLGRSRLLENGEEVDVEDLTTERTNGKKSDQGSIKRKDAKIDEFSEAKLLNFYSMTGINFQNIASNDAIIGSKLTEMAEKGWRLIHVTSAAESDSGKDDGTGIYITRFIFTR